MRRRREEWSSQFECLENTNVQNSEESSFPVFNEDFLVKLIGACTYLGGDDDIVDDSLAMA